MEDKIAKTLVMLVYVVLWVFNAQEEFSNQTQIVELLIMMLWVQSKTNILK